MQLTEEEFAALFSPYDIPKAEAGQPLCPYCGMPLGPEGLDYYGTQTEAGTEGCEVEISCERCLKTIWRGGAWGSIDSHDDLRDAVEEALAYQGMLGIIEPGTS